MKQKYFRLSEDDVVQICASLKCSMQAHQDVKDILIKIRQYRIWTDEEVRQYNEMTDEIEKLQAVYNKFI